MSQKMTYKAVLMGDLVEPTGMRKARPLSTWNNLSDAYYERAKLMKHDSVSHFYIELVPHEPGETLEGNYAEQSNVV